MCDYSLSQVKSRAANVADKLTTHDFGTGTRGFCAAEDPGIAVCVLPGTELSFAGDIKVLSTGLRRTRGAASGWDVAQCFRLDRPNVLVLYTLGKQ